MNYTDNILVDQATRALAMRLPARWAVRSVGMTGRDTGVDAVVGVTAPDDTTASVTVICKKSLNPQAVTLLVERLGPSANPSDVLVVSPYLSASTRERLRDRGLNYLDLTGNVRIAITTPGLFIETQGATQDPDREERPARTLRGAKTGRIVRALIDCKQPPGVRELAELTGLDAGYVSRVMALLETEALVTRVGRGRLESVDWPKLLRRWAEEAPITARGIAGMYLDPRGTANLVKRLAGSTEQYAITGSLAAAHLAPIAPTRLAVVWVRDAQAAAVRLGLTSVEVGANVMLLEPRDEGVLTGAAVRDGVSYAAPSQAAADLLTSPGRGPAEGEELIAWMQANEEAWRG